LKKPNKGDRVEVIDINGTKREGTVFSVLSAQFTYDDTEGIHRWCLFNGEWRKLNGKG
jgi:hypothetical protein